MSAAHTPGPWEAKPIMRGDGQQTGYYFRAATHSHNHAPSRGGEICAIAFAKTGAKRGTAPRWYSSEADHANARLIAAAPALAEALREFVRYQTDIAWADERDRIAREATDGMVTHMEALTERARAALKQAGVES